MTLMGFGMGLSIAYGLLAIVIGSYLLYRKIRRNGGWKP